MEIFNSEKVGNDKTRGKVDLDIADVLSMHGQERNWSPLAGIKSGNILLSADFLEDLARNARDILPMEIERINEARSLAADEMQTYCRVSAQSGDNQPSQPCIPAEQAQGARGLNLHPLQHQLPCQDLLQHEHFHQPPPD